MINIIREKTTKIYKPIFLSAFFLLAFIFFNILISTVLFIFKLSIQKFFMIISLILSIFITFFYLKKKDLLKEKRQGIYNTVISIILPIVIIFLAIFLNGKVFDYTWDGNSYQKATTGMMAIGWNPLYEELEDFDDNSKEQINIGDESPVYINNYPKASNVFAANIYKFTGNIETGKALNTITIVMLFLFTFSFLLYKNKSISFSILFSICTVTYPVVCAQFLTNYIDLLVYAFLYLTIFSFFIFEEDEFVFSKKDNLFLFFMLLTISINLKTSLFGFVGLFCLAYYAWYFYRFIKREMDKQFFVDFTITAVLSVLVGVFVIGLSVYPKNLIDHGHPFYPLMGEGAVDIMSQNQPENFKEKSPVEKFAISFFSEVDDIIQASDENIKFKIPFTVHKEELSHVGLPDLRLSGNGIFFSGIFLISIIIIVYFIKDLYNKNSRECILFIIPMSVTLLMIVFLQEAWWARYFPQLYIFVLLALLILDEKCKSKIAKVLKYGFITVLLVNNLTTFLVAVKSSYENNVVCNVEFQKYESLNLSEKAKLTVYTSSYHGTKFNVLDKVNQEDVTFLYKYPEDKTGVNTFFGGKVEWRYDDEEVY